MQLLLASSALAVAAIALAVAVTVFFRDQVLPRATLTALRNDVNKALGMIEDTNEQLHKGLSRVGMRQRRSKDAVPDERTDPEGYRRYLEEKNAGKLAALRAGSGYAKGN